MEIPDRIGAVFAAGVLALAAADAWAWGATGHRLAAIVAVERAPPDLPAFLKEPEAIAWLGELGREPDRSKGAGQSHDRNANPGHYLNLGDSGLVAGAVPLAPLPPDRERYAMRLQANGISEYQAGYLPYSIVDGWQQLRKDFAYWRAETAALQETDSAEERAWYERDRRLRELIILRDLGYWSHFVADGSQPMHVSVHHNGWGNYPNPEGFTQSPLIHAAFEGAYVAAHVDRDALQAAMPLPRELGCDIEERTVAYLTETNRQVVPLYRLEKLGQFALGQTAGRGFVLERLAAAAAEIRDLMAAAWRCSAAEAVGYPPVEVRRIESGEAKPFRQLRGLD